MNMNGDTTGYYLCITDRGEPLSVLPGRVYRVLEPRLRDGGDSLRVVDEVGEDYLYPRDWFLKLDVPVEMSGLLEAALGGNEIEATYHDDGEDASLPVACVLCRRAGDNSGSLVRGRVYELLHQESGERPECVRIVDEHGDPASYPRGWFEPVELSQPLSREMHDAEYATAHA